MLFSERVSSTLVRIDIAMEGEDASHHQANADLLMVLTSFAFLIPATYAFSAGRPWHCAVFTAMTLICVLYHISDATTEPLLSMGKRLPLPHHALTIADHVSAYFCIFQMTLLIVGPEDHNLQWPYDAASSRQPCKTSPHVPSNVVISCRILPLLAFITFGCAYPDWRKFHFQMTFLTVSCLVLALGQFWLSCGRAISLRDHAQNFALRAVFWRRLGTLGILPLLLICGVFFVMESIGEYSGIAHAGWHILVACMALNIQRTIYHSLADPLHACVSYLVRQNNPISDIHSTSSQNPVVAHCVLGSLCVTAGVTFIVGSLVQMVASKQTGNYKLLDDVVSLGSHDWPVLGLDTLRWQVGYLVAAGSLFVLLAIAGTFALVGAVSVDAERSKDSDACRYWRQLGLTIGSSSVLFGIITILASAAVDYPQFRALALAFTICSLAFGITLVTFCEGWNAASGPVMALRRSLAASIAMLSIVFMASLHTLSSVGVLHNVGITALSHSVEGFPWFMVAFSQYCLVTLVTVWPMTYATQVYEHWAPKALPNPKWAKWPQIVAGIEY